MYQKYNNMFDAIIYFIFACAKFVVYFGTFYCLLFLGALGNRNSILSEENERAIKDLERRTIELEKRGNNYKNLKSLFFDEFMEE